MFRDETLVLNGVRVGVNAPPQGSPFVRIDFANRNRNKGTGLNEPTLIIAREEKLDNDISISILRATGTIHLTKMEALALSHQLRKLAIGV